MRFLFISTHNKVMSFLHMKLRALLQSVQIHDGHYDPHSKVVEDNFWDSKYDAVYEESANCINIKFVIHELIDK